ncbi:MAG: hypothetical protein CMO98_10840 [Woeseia sp.]|nr:hypothetical protein [Woeseia sp.]
MPNILPWLAVFLIKDASSFPEGAPWGTANFDSEQSCAACHFDYDPIFNSDALLVEGLPDRLLAGTSHEIVITLESLEALTAGFQMLASKGQFTSIEHHTEYIGSAIRSTKATNNANGFSWSLIWTAPPKPNTKVLFYLAVTGANGDGSPFGDLIHFWSFETLVQ